MPSVSKVSELSRGCHSSAKCTIEGFLIEDVAVTGRSANRTSGCLVQVCLLDLDYNLPVQVRDQALGMEDEALPESDVGKEYQLERMSKEGELDSSFAKAKPNDTILKLQRTTPYYQVWRLIKFTCFYGEEGQAHAA